MYNNDSIKITLFSSLLCGILTIIIAITIVNYSYHHPDNQQFFTLLLYIQAQSDNKDNKKKAKQMQRRRKIKIMIRIGKKRKRN